MATPLIANCKLCNAMTTLKWSHIVPRWAYRRVIQTGGTGAPKIVNVQEDIATFGGAQFAEFMLCEACEQRISRWENHVARIALQTDDTFLALSHAQTRLNAALTISNWTGADLSALQPETIARFATSVVWRASVSRTFEKVNLGAYGKEIAGYLLDDNASFPSCACLVLQLIDHSVSPRIDRVVVAPSSSKDGRYHVHHFAMFGMWFQLMVGGSLPSKFDQLCVARSGQAVITSGEKLLRLVGKHAAGVTPKGSLAQRSRNR